MKKIPQACVIAAAALCLSTGIAEALPFLQLDIGGGTYNTADQTTYANSSTFTLYALADTTQGSVTSTRQFAISAALTPQLAQSLPAPNFGTFKVNGVSYSASSANVTFGTPPLDSVFDNIPGHGVFPTYFAEFVFSFDLADRATAYNVQENPGDPVANSSGSLVYKAFNIDVSGLLAGYGLHFDLYDPEYKKTIFAPFSHDAQSGGSTPGTGGGSSVPDGGLTLTLLGAGIFAIGAFRARLASR